MSIILVLNVYSVLTGQPVKPLDLRTDVLSIQGCYMSAASIIAATVPEVMSDDGMKVVNDDGQNDVIKMKSFECRNQ